MTVTKKRNEFSHKAGTIWLDRDGAQTEVFWFFSKSRGSKGVIGHSLSVHTSRDQPQTPQTTEILFQSKPVHKGWEW